MAKFFAEYLDLKVEEPKPITIEYKVFDVPYVSQLYPVYVPIGCEPTSLYSALRYKGYASGVNHRQFLDNMPYDNINPNRGFVGHYSGYKDRSKRETIFPNALAKYAQKYGNVYDISGYSMEQIKEEIMLDNPALIYVTLSWDDPKYADYYVEGKKYNWLYNNHVVVVCGYNPQNNEYYVSDPLNKKDKSKPFKYWVNGDRLEYLYNARKQAIAVR